MFRKLIAIWMIPFVFLSGVAMAQIPYTNIIDIRLLSQKKAEEWLPVQIEAQVVCVNPYKNSFFLFNGKDGIYVDGNQAESSTRSLKAGDIVRVKGVTTAGSFIPDIAASNIQVMENKPRPKPVWFYDSDIVNTTRDCKWGMVRGRLFSTSISPDKTSIFLKLNRVDAVEINAHLPYSEYNAKRIREFMFRFVEFGAVCGTVANENRQMIGRIFYANSADDFSLGGEEWHSNIEDSAKIHELMRYGVSFNRPVRIHGIVLHARNREIYLRGEKACLKIATSEPFSAEPGDKLSVTGFIWLQPVSPAFHAENIQTAGESEAPAPVRLDPSKPLDPLLNYDLVEIDAELVELKTDYSEGETEPHYIMRCRSAGEFFEAQIPGGIKPDNRLVPGALLRLTGICNMQKKPGQQLDLTVSGFWLQLRGSNDAEILKPAPWWTTARLLMLLGGMLAVALISISWIIVLRRTVDRQTGIIAEKVERESIHEERQRIARELHDNLEQALSGAIFQLGGVRRAHKMNTEKNQLLLENAIRKGEQATLEQFSNTWQQETEQNTHALEAVENMLSHCSVESRNSILDLRGGPLEKMDLVEAVKVTLRKLEGEHGAIFELQLKGEPVRFALAMERNLLLTIKEATLNAVHHATPSRVKLVLDYTDGLKVTVVDDGCGFNVEERMNAGRFGLKGMMERMQNINGSLNIESNIGSGTAVTAWVPAT